MELKTKGRYKPAFHSVERACVWRCRLCNARPRASPCDALHPDRPHLVEGEDAPRRVDARPSTPLLLSHSGRSCVTRASGSLGKEVASRCDGDTRTVPPTRRSPERCVPLKNDPRPVSGEPRPGDAEPRHGTSGPRRGHNAPRRGRIPPSRRRTCPTRGGRWPRRGGMLPRDGGDAPRRGRSGPSTSGIAPSRGDLGPRRGNSSPRHGNTLPRSGGS